MTWLDSDLVVEAQALPRTSVGKLDNKARQ